jgi:hypothetical protein
MIPPDHRILKQPPDAPILGSLTKLVNNPGAYPGLFQNFSFWNKFVYPLSAGKPVF